MKLTSPRFEYGKKIPEEYTCDGKNISPPLEISEVPKEAKSLVLIMEDPDVPKSIREDGMWDHWVVFNIPSEITKIGEGQNPPGKLGINTRNRTSYQGPCPPDKEHRYFFRLFALDADLNLSPGVSKNHVLEAIKNHVLGEAVLMGVYERKK